MKNYLNRLLKYPHFPIIALTIIMLLIGLFTFQDYGQSWDEPLFYAYADSVPYAYSISARLNGTFNIEQAYGPSAADHMRYGPAYILVGRPVEILVEGLTGSPHPDGWHWVNFLAFTLGIIFLYLLTLKLTRHTWSAFCAALFFVTQPLFWGHAFINPKDIPFTAFFIISMYTGILMVERAQNPWQTAPGSKSEKAWKITRALLWALTGISFLLTVIFFVFPDQVLSVFIGFVAAVYKARPDSILGSIFSLLTVNARNTALEIYLLKMQAIFPKLKLLSLATFLVMLTFSMLVGFFKTGIQKTWNILSIRLHPGWTVFAAFMLGFTSAIRVLGPLAGALVSLYFLTRYKQRALVGLVIYWFSAVLVMVAFWPYLWGAPLQRLIDVLLRVSNNPQPVGILFNGALTSSLQLTSQYLLTMLGITLTEPVWLVSLAGLGIALASIRSRRADWKLILPVALWFFIPFLYAIIATPPLYDGIRHFMFMMPPVFVFSGFAFYYLFTKVTRVWLNSLLVFLILLPGLIGLVSLHPYEYTYYNSLVGGTGGAFRRFETDYWLTCYKETIEAFDKQIPGSKTLYVLRNPRLASAYATEQITLEQYDSTADNTAPGSYLLLPTRINSDQDIHPEAPVVIQTGKKEAVFCVVKAIK